MVRGATVYTRSYSHTPIVNNNIIHGYGNLIIAHAECVRDKKITLVYFFIDECCSKKTFCLSISIQKAFKDATDCQSSHSRWELSNKTFYGGH